MSWREKITPFDENLFRMVQSLTGEKCVARNGGSYYFIVVDYSRHRDSDYVSAVLAAIQGRTGERFISMTDEPEAARVIVRIRFSKEKYEPIIKKIQEDEL